MRRKLSRISLAAGTLLVLSLCLPWTIIGKTPDRNKVRKYVPDAPVQAPAQDEWTFSADRVVGDHTSEYVEAFGNVSLSLGEDQLRADFARYYQATGWVFLKGNIRAHWGGDFLQADEGEFDLNNMTGWLKNGKLFMAKPHVYVEAERVGKAVGDTYTFKNAKVTSCSGEKPAWSVTTEEGDVTIDGRIHLYRSAFRVKDVPVFYWPYMVLPGKGDRQSGFLMPYVSSSDKLGLQVNLPYYWVINDEMDATFYQNYMSKRGYMQGVEFRHTEDASSRGMWQANILSDKVRATSESDEWADYQEDGLTRSNRDRWWVRGKYDGWLGSPQWKIKLDLDVVSDQNYMRDFQYGPDGYEKTREEFLDVFGRDIENKDSLHRLSKAYVSRSWDRFGVVGLTQYDENLAYRNGNNPSSEDPTIQILPELNAYAWQQSLGAGFEGAVDAKYDYFHRNYGDSGHRLILSPELKYPLKSRFLTVIPSLSMQETAYSLSSREAVGDLDVVGTGGRDSVIDTTKIKDGFQTRTLWTGGFTAFSEMTRTFALGEAPAADPGLAGTSRWTSLKNSIMPRLDYTYRNNLTGQEKLPYFDTDDRVEGLNQVTYSLTSVLDRRRERVVLSPGSDGEPAARVAKDYLDFLLFRVEQSYDIREAQRNDERDLYARRPFSDVMAELKIKPANFMEILTRNWFSPYMGDMTQSENTLRFYKDGLGEFYVGYDFLKSLDEYKRTRDNDMSIIKIGGEWQVNNAVTLGARYRHDFVDEQDLERTLYMDWAAECYTLHFSYSQKPGDNRFEVGFDLLNF
ncbi:Organic solvent tolerance protein [Pseudodesulfovibrio mercurii]|uniref:Organic solvent tolerance protein n=1 Tax=Pseudodesulfovibrio mercurii TaxID=641491 RepID=F0JFV8_9BACT|nr:LPS assembly protein LptD [Pseudodesulfovibrio mercurii]EGB14954.1 Organic solvent tolerance protein [Pseudodesulfovibrio mercurii]